MNTQDKHNTRGGGLMDCRIGRFKSIYEFLRCSVSFLGK